VTGAHDVLSPAGPQAAHIAGLWWTLFGASTIVFVLVLGALAIALARARRGDALTSPELAPPPSRERAMGRRIAVAIAICAVALVGLLVASIGTDRALAQLAIADALHLKVTAHQFWWQVTYDDPQPGRVFETANEIRIPVGRPIVITLDSPDVIHSLWIPSLHGKKDLIPGRTATLRLRADTAGEFRGQCAEYCGLQHAFMALDVVALAPDAYERWAEVQRRPAAEPAGERERRGRELFLTGSCMMCHAVRGTAANAHAGPDLTHLASRAHLAAGRLANTPQELRDWIADPQKAKPGVNMPAHHLPPADLEALVAYLGTLQ
jgi:cytochrome c oxidase subunit 2